MVALRRRKSRVPATRREVIAKVCLLGDARSGKGPLLLAHVYTMFPDKYVTTIGTKVTKKTILVKRAAGAKTSAVRLTLLIWDILGQKQYSHLHPVYYQGAVGALVVCDASAEDALESLRRWAHDFESVVGKTPLAFVINEGRGDGTTRADAEGVDALARAFDAPIFRLRPGDTTAVEDMFMDLGSRILDARDAALALEGAAPLGTLRRRRRWLPRRGVGVAPAAPESGPAATPAADPDSGRKSPPAR